ncbi:MAG: hypothetical protein QM758_11645 [Armatimonas sp.]
MNQERWRELASEYIEGTLTPPMQEAVEVHLRENPESRAEAEQLRALFAELKQVPEVEPPLYFAENVMSRIQREAEQKRPWWSSFLGIGRTAGATLVLGGAAAGIAWMFLNPQQRVNTTPGTPRQARTLLLPGLSGSEKAPGNPVALSIPHLNVERTLRVAPGEEPAFDFSVKLESATTGTARFELPGDSQNYRVVVEKGRSSTLRVPLVSARDEQTMALRCDWSAGGDRHVKYLLVPLPPAEKDDATQKLSFGLGEMTLPDTARALAARYGRPITLEDIPEGLRVSVIARTETLEETLTRHLKDTGLHVTSTGAGVLIAPLR